MSETIRWYEHGNNKIHILSTLSINTCPYIYWKEQFSSNLSGGNFATLHTSKAVNILSLLSTHLLTHLTIQSCDRFSFDRIHCMCVHKTD